MARPDPRPVLAKAINAGAHPAAPLSSVPPPSEAPVQECAATAAHPEETTESPPATTPAEPMVMFSVRIPQGLRRAVKLAAVEQGSTIGEWVETALRAALES